MSEVLEAVPLDQVELPFLDLQGEAWAKDPWAEARRIHEQGPMGGRLARSSRGIEILRYAEYEQVTSDRRLQQLHTDYWEQQGAGPLTLDFIDNGHLLTFDPERHLKIRRIMVKAFRMSHIEEQREWFGELANRLVDDFAERGECDLLEDFSHRYSIEILCRMIGVPSEDIPKFERATLDIALMNALPLRPHVPQLEAALKTIWDYSVEIVERRRAKPREDFISGLIEAQETEGKLSEAEAIWGVANLLFAGHDTTRYQLGSAVQTIVEAGEWEAIAAQPELIPAALEEAIRLYPVVHVTTRVVMDDDDVVVAGVQMPQGTVMRANWFAFNRDPERFPDPDRFDLRRAEISTRIPFGVGVHKCIGHALARADLEVALKLLSSRLTNVEIVGEVPRHPYSGGMGGPKRLPLRFERR